MSTYLDIAATAPVRREVLEAMWPYLTDNFANASSVHESGQRARAALDWAREHLAAACGTVPEGVIFTSGGTEADNLAVQGLATRGQAIRSGVEHPAVARTMDALAERRLIAQHIVPVDGRGGVDLADLERALETDTSLVSIMIANNEIGTVQPIGEIGALCQAAGVPLHTDGVQAAATLPIDMAKLGISALTIAGHKLGAPQGSGALLLSPKTRIEPLMFGGSQQYGMRPGTENVAAAVGLAVAVDLAVAERHQVAQLARETETLIRELRACVPELVLTGPEATGDEQRVSDGQWPQRLPGNVSFCIPGIHGESLLLGLQERGFEVSSGSACAAGHTEPSEVLLAIGLAPALAESAVRCTFGLREAEHLPAFVNALADAVTSLRAFG